MPERKVGVLTEKLTDKQENFVLALINGKSQREAYRSAYKAEVVSRIFRKLVCRLRHE